MCAGRADGGAVRGRRGVAEDGRGPRPGKSPGAVAEPQRGPAIRPAALASAPGLKQDRRVTTHFAPAALRTAAASAGRARPAAANARANNNNRNNASLPRAGD